MNNKKKTTDVVDTDQDTERLPVILVGSGIGLLILGFIVLGMANRMADNWAGFTAPLLLVSGWIVIAAGLWKAEK